MDEKKVREAIERLRVGIDVKREMIKHNKAFFQKQDNSYLESDIEVYCTAIEALEKQISKKPICVPKLYSEELGFNDEIHCPSCRRYVGFLWRE